MDERPLDPGRLYLLKHNARTVTAEVDRGARAERDRHGASSRRPAPLLFDPLRGEPRDRQLHPDRSGDELHGRRRDDRRRRSRRVPRTVARPAAAERLARRARTARRPRPRPSKRSAACSRRSWYERSRSVCRVRCARAVAANRGRRGAVRDRRASRPSASCSCTCCARSRPDIPVLFLDTVHHFAETYAYRDELAAEWGLNLVNLRAAEPRAGAVAAGHARRAAAAQGGAAVRRARGLRRVVHRAAPRPVARRAPTSSEVEPFTLPTGNGAPQGQPARALDARRTCWAYAQARTTSRSCRSTSWATRASAASRARRCRSTRPTSARAAGRDRSSSAASTCEKQ